MVNAKPIISDGTATICAGGSIDLTTKITSYATYLSPVWTEATAVGTSVATPTAVKPTATTTYVLVAQNALGCKDTANVVVTVDAKPVITDGTATICAGESVDLTTKITSYVTYLSPVWTEVTAGGTSVATATAQAVVSALATTTAVGTSVATPTAVKPTATTTYVLVAQNALGCKDTANVVITVNAKPNAGTDQSLACTNAGTNTLTTSTTLTPNPTGGMWLQIGTSPATTSITGNAVSAMSVAGTYQFEYSLNGCKDTIVVNVQPCTGCVQPNAGTDATVCQPITTAKLTAVTTGGTWSGQSVNPPTANIDVNGNITGLSTAGTYKFIYSVTSDGITCTDTAQVMVNAKPIIADGLATICAGESVDLITKITSYATYLSPVWTEATTVGTSVATPTAVKPTATTTYVLVAQNALGCKDTANVVVTVNAKPVITDGTATICAGESVDLITKITSYATYLSPVWTEATTVGTSVATPTAVKPTATTTYVLVAQNALGCKDTANVVVTVNAKPVISDGTATICAGESVDLTTKITSYVTYLSPVWTEVTAGGASVSTPTAVKPTATTTYVLVAQNALGCKDTANVVVTVNAKPVITDGTATICAGESVDLTTKITSYATYLSPVWTVATAGGTAVSTPTAVKPTATTTYVLVAQNALGCKDTANVVVTVDAKPVITDGTATICAGESVDLTTKITSYVTYLSPVWTEVTAGGVSVSTPTAVKPRATTTYVLVAQNALGCKDTANVVVTVNAKPVITDGTATICAGESVDLTTKITSYVTYLSPVWTEATAGGVSVSTPTAVKPTATTTYVLVAQNALGCKDTANVVVTVNAKPNAGTDQTLACANAGTNTLTTSTTLTPNPTGGMWLQIGTSPATASITANAVSGMSVAGTYQFEYSLNGCKDTVVINVQPCTGCVKPNAGADAAAICQPITTAKLTAVTTGGTWSAQTGNPATANIDNNGNITGLSTAGTYKFIYSVTGGGVTCTDTAQVTVNTKPVITDGTATICAGGSVDLTSKITSYATYLSPVWTVATVGGASVSTPTAVKPTATTTYVLVAQNALGCKDTANVVVTVNAKPNAGTDQALVCANAGTNTLTTTTTLTPNPTGGMWLQIGTSPATASITANAVSGMSVVGTYQFEYSLNGCRDTVSVTVSPCSGCVKPNAGVDQTLICSVAGIAPSSATLAPITSGGIWTAQTGNPATTTINTNAISGMTVSGIYKFIYSVTSGGQICTDTVQILVPTCIIPKGSLGDFVWKDANNNGIQDETTANAGGVANVIVELYKNGTLFNKDTTDATGHYLFTNLDAGTYKIKIVSTTFPAGCEISRNPNAGTDDAKDSDVDKTTGFSGDYVINPTDPTKKDILTVDAGVSNICVQSPQTVFSTCIDNVQLPAPKAGQVWSVMSGNPSNAIINQSGMVTGMTALGIYHFTLSNANGTCSETFDVTHSDCTKKYDLSLKKKVNNKLPQLNEVINYTIVVKNEGEGTATGVEVSDTLPSGLQYQSFNVVRGTGVYSPSTNVWNLGTLVPGDSAILTISVKVMAQGVMFNKAEISKMNEKDIDSTPGNNNENEDDLGRACISVPLNICQGEQVQVTIPATFQNVQWFKTVGATTVFVQTGNTISISTSGTYTYLASNGNCPAEGCCPVIVIVGDCCKPNVCIPFNILKIKGKK